MKKLFVFLIAFFPVSAKIRAFLYNLLPAYRISSTAKIGFGTTINVGECVIQGNVRIGKLVRIKNIDYFSVGDNSLVNSSCMFCGPVEQLKHDVRKVVIGREANIQCGHYFDVVSPITMGDSVVIAGKGTQFFTHSFDIEGNRLDGAILIGNRVYIGTGSIINLGVQICDNTVLQAGTVLNETISESGVYGTNQLYRKGNIRRYDELFQETAQLTEYKCFSKKK